MTGTQHNSRLARWALKLQEYDFKIRHRRGTQNSNADAMSRPPIAHDEGEPRIAMLNVYETQPLEFFSDSDTERVTYATDSAQSPQLKGGSDSGKSVPDARCVRDQTGQK